jgi:ABC-type branched-subunit amino acid transport system substrate-binding protein
VQKLIDEERCALFGLASTANVAAALPIINDKQVPLIDVYTGSPSLRAKHHPHFFTTMANYRDEVFKMARNQKTLLRGNTALVYMNNLFSQLMIAVVNEVIKDQEAKLVASVARRSCGDAQVAGGSDGTHGHGLRWLHRELQPHQASRHQT